MRPKALRVNEEIKLPKLRVIGEDGQHIGVLSRDEALSLARERGLDLVEIVPNAQPPVCKIIDYGKYKYEESKKSKTAKKQHSNITKEIKMRLNIEEHDYTTKLHQAEKFLSTGYKVRVILMLRGREIEYAEKGIALLTRFAESLGEKARVEQPVKKEERIITIVIVPQKKCRN